MKHPLHASSLVDCCCRATRSCYPATSHQTRVAVQKCAAALCTLAGLGVASVVEMALQGLVCVLLQYNCSSTQELCQRPPSTTWLVRAFLKHDSNAEHD